MLKIIVLLTRCLVPECSGLVSKCCGNYPLQIHLSAVVAAAPKVLMRSVPSHFGIVHIVRVEMFRANNTCVINHYM
jgi:hypothetical protein